MSGSGAVQFSYANWIARYPEFNGVGSNLAQLYFNEATLYCANNTSRIGNVNALTMFLNMLTAHIACLNSPVTSIGQNPTSPPGRVSQASEGTVSASFEYTASPGSEAWYTQTKYGAAYWRASTGYRLARVYVPTCPGPASLAQLPWTYTDAETS